MLCEDTAGSATVAAFFCASVGSGSFEGQLIGAIEICNSCYVLQE